MRSEKPYSKFFDRAFENEMNSLIEQTIAHYEATNFKSALKTGLFSYQNARGWYRDVTGGDMHRDLVLRFIETQALLIAPIAPHWSEYIWRDVLKKVSFKGELTDCRMAPFKTPPSPNHHALKIKWLLQHRDMSRVFPMPFIKLKVFNSRRRPKANKVNLILVNQRNSGSTSRKNFLHGNRNISTYFKNPTMRYLHRIMIAN